jgi:hypothetical protein
MNSPTHETLTDNTGKRHLPIRPPSAKGSKRKIGQAARLSQIAKARRPRFGWMQMRSPALLQQLANGPTNLLSTLFCAVVRFAVVLD